MAAPIDDIAAAIQTALSNALKENANLFTGGGTGSGGGGGTGTGTPGLDPISLVTGLGFLALLGAPEVLGIVEALKTGAGDAGDSAASFGSGYLLGNAAFQFAEPYLRYVTHFVENEAQSQIFDPVTAADLAARQIITPAFGQSEAGGGGFDSSHWNDLLDAAYARPQWDVALRLWNRGYINETDVNTALQYGGVPAYWWPALKQMRQEILTPADLALAALRGNISAADAQNGAAQWGVSADDFATLMQNTGEPPGEMQLLEAYRRGFINTATLERGIRQSRIRDEWIPTIEALRYVPMSTANAANAVVRGYLSAADGATIAQQNGLEPDHWQYVLESNGRPPSHEQLASLYLRGIITEADFEQGIRESDIKDKYIADVVDLRVKFLPLFEARTLLNDGSITGATFTEQLIPQGYEPAVIAEIVANAGTGKKSAAKHLSVSDYVDLYTDGLKSRADTSTGLQSIGYTLDDATSILDIADAKVANAIVKQQVANVRAQFDKFKLTQDAASVELSEIGLAGPEVTRLIDAWTIVRPISTRTLTEAQVLKALKLGAIDAKDALARLVALGLNEIDAALLMEIDG